MAKKTKESAAVAFDEKDFQAESDMRTLIEAEKIKGDKKRLSRAVKKAKEQREALASVTRTKEK